MVSAGEAADSVSSCEDNIDSDLRSNAVVSVQHAGDSIEPEPVKLVLVHPETKIAE